MSKPEWRRPSWGSTPENDPPAAIPTDCPPPCCSGLEAHLGDHQWADRNGRPTPARVTLASIATTPAWWYNGVDGPGYYEIFVIDDPITGRRAEYHRMAVCPFCRRRPNDAN
jgi:hypothetical protein